MTENLHRHVSLTIYYSTVLVKFLCSTATLKSETWDVRMLCLCITLLIGILMSDVSINSFAQSLACLSYAKSIGTWLEDDGIDHLGETAYEDALILYVKLLEQMIMPLM